VPSSREALGKALGRLYARIPLGMRLGLEPMLAACAREGHPENAFASVHVTGTNGKGSVCAMVESIARAHGMKTGLYTSPHLSRFAERIRIDGEPIDDDTLVEVLHHALDAAPELSFFETATLAAFLTFRRARVDVAVVEVGIGGRLDATNVIASPRAAAITRIALEHTDRLGPTLADIAREKAGIAKAGVDLVLGPIPADLRAVIDAVARERGATTSTTVHVAVPETIGLPGDHQRENAAVAIALASRLGASEDAVARGLAAARWPGRLERIGPILLDAAHNPDGAFSLARYVRTLGVPAARTVLVFGALAEKDWRSMLEALAPLAASRIYVAPEVAARSAVDARTIAAYRPGMVAGTVDDALAAAHAAGGDLVVVSGSMFLVGAARSRLLSLSTDPPVAL
jgi:dihydrofolate synthase/folylpolyglutamate synthase